MNHTSSILQILHSIPFELPNTDRWSLNRFVQIWKSHLNNPKSYNRVLKFTNNDYEVFSLPYYPHHQEKLIIKFNVTNISKLLSDNRIQFTTHLFSDIYSVTRFNYHPNTTFDLSGFDQHIVAINLPCYQCGKYSFFEIIDGNHRLSSIVDNNYDAHISVIDNYYLLPDCFVSDSDFCLFHVIQGIAWLTLTRIDAERYVKNLSTFLNSVHP